jgi:polysaccharide biosynthesis/export protein
MRLIAWKQMGLVSALALTLGACASDTPPPIAAAPTPAPAAPLAAVAAAPATAGTPAAEAPTEVFDASSYRVDSGDKVKVIVYGEPELSGEFLIDGKGDLSIPLVGTINAKSLTVRQMEAAISKKLEQGYIVEPKINVEVLNYRPFYIIGEVRNPGNYAFVSGMTVTQAVAMAGGYTYRARETSAVMKRSKTPDREELVPVSAGVMPGDVIIIKERYF